MHLLRFLGISLLLGIAGILIIPQLVWQAHIFNKTGYRTIDLLWLFVPFAGVIVATKTTWRYVAKDTYWLPQEAS